jgi:hypothetical protein
MDVNRLNASIRDIKIPLRMSRRPISDQGYPVPWFVAEIDGQWDFRVIGPGKMYDAYHKRLCWLCGEKLGRHLCFVIGPMCSINRVNSEPPSHLECALYAAKACPFLSKPRMRRNEVELPDGPAIAGQHLSHNPGAMAIWITKSYAPFKVTGGTLFKLGDPTNVLWYAEGRPATREEVMTAIHKGLPHLRHMAALEGTAAKQDLEVALLRVMTLLPKETDDAGSVRLRESSGEGVRDNNESPNEGRASDS